MAGKYVVDANVLATCGFEWISRGGRWPEVPPARTPSDLCTLAIANDAYDDWALWLSPKLLDLAGKVLRGELGQQFRKRPLPAADVETYLQDVALAAAWSGGGVAEPQGRVFGLFNDSEDDKNVGSLVVTVGAHVVVSRDQGVQAAVQRTVPNLGGKDQLVLFVAPDAFVEQVTAHR